jgi:hypothetical protein
VTARTTTPESSPIAELQDFCNLDFYNHGLERAIEIEKASLATFVSLGAYAIDLSKSASLFAPMAFSPLGGDFFDVATKAYASFFDLQMHWLALLMPQAAKPAASGPSGQDRTKPVQTKAKALESGMDAVIGTAAGRKS